MGEVSNSSDPPAQRRKKESFCASFIEKVKEELTCPVCIDLVSEPFMQCANGHVVCKNCQQKVNDALRKKCCVCKGCFVNEGVPDPLYKLFIEELKEMCKFCDQKFCQKDIEHHEARCEHRIIDCPVQGCNHKTKANKLKEHFKESGKETHLIAESKIVRFTLKKDVGTSLCWIIGCTAVQAEVTAEHELSITAFATGGSEERSLQLYRSTIFGYHGDTAVTVNFKQGVGGAKPLKVLISNFLDDSQQHVIFVINVKGK